MAQEWTNHEVQKMYQNYENEGPSGMMLLLPNRSRAAIINKARVLGIKIRPQSWSDEDNAIIREYYPKVGSFAVQKMLPNRTRMAIRLQAFKLGVKYRASGEQYLKKKAQRA